MVKYGKLRVVGAALDAPLECAGKMVIGGVIPITKATPVLTRPNNT